MTSPRMAHAGVATLAGTLILRFPLKFDRVHPRSSAHPGTSTLLLLGQPPLYYEQFRFVVGIQVGS